MAGTAVTVSLAGCSSSGADHASYWSESRQLDIDYDAVLTAARDTGYTVDEPYYVGTKDARGVHPAGVADFDDRFGPEYRVFGFTFFPAEYVFVEVWLTDETPTVTLIDDRGFDEFPVESVPPEAWLIDRLTLAFDISETTARDHVADLREQVAEGTSNPSIDVDASVSFPRVYEAIETERTDASGSETGGDGWYKETSYRDGTRYATVDIIVQSAEIKHEDGDRTYTIELDRLGGLYVTIGLPVGEEIPEDEYRQVLRDMFEDVGLPTEVVDDLTFEYAGSIW
ncbi:hypothetical protein DQW50_05630 [Halorubrum sp. 48-1-W]|uniref:hypothetical protein n=1 Tax=Halorubrum sp. 48-1-W TaxID=2249761 RepID=UPI000DCF0705|nr:hypothetical protein [Halorubrum sp. 48-1-W]RAW46247.1 hypothetical protein DQW50_05630 [Halorubrum sp. 48-1-W]